MKSLILNQLGFAGLALRLFAFFDDLEEGVSEAFWQANHIRRLSNRVGGARRTRHRGTVLHGHRAYEALGACSDGETAWTLVAAYVPDGIVTRLSGHAGAWRCD